VPPPAQLRSQIRAN